MLSRCARVSGSAVAAAPSGSLPEQPVMHITINSDRIRPCIVARYFPARGAAGSRYRWSQSYTVSHHTTAFCGFSTQCPSSGK
jgi:hypothetical protein